MSRRTRSRDVIKAEESGPYQWPEPPTRRRGRSQTKKTATATAEPSPVKERTLNKKKQHSTTSPAPAAVLTTSPARASPTVATAPAALAASVSPGLDTRLLSLPSEIAKLKDEKAELATTLQQTQRDLAALLKQHAITNEALRTAQEDSRRFQEDAAIKAEQLLQVTTEKKLLEHRLSTVSEQSAEVTVLSEELIKTTTENNLHQVRLKAARDKTDEVVDELRIHQKEIQLLRARVEHLTSENHKLRVAAEEPRMPVDAILTLQSQIAGLRCELSSVRDATKDMATDFATTAAAASKRAINMIQQHESLNAMRSHQIVEAAERRAEELKSALDSDEKVKSQLVEQFRVAYEERRRLHNALQEAKGSVRVFCRARPLRPDEGEYHARLGCMEEGTPGQIFIIDPKSRKETAYGFDAVFGPSDLQDDVFKEVSPLLVSLVDGYNLCLFAYGQTGSGKTYTMEGPPDGSIVSSPGVGVRSVAELYRLMEERSEHFSFTTSASYIEIYNETFRDLLSPASSSAASASVAASAGDGTPSSTKLEIRETARGSVLPGLTIVDTTSPQDVIDVIAVGRANRSFGATDANAHSSRSHCILSITVESTNKLSGQRMRSKLHLVDLAGSERLNHSNAVGERRKEAISINSSLSALGQVFNCMQAGYTHIPYRNSKLTHFLKDSLRAGSCKTVMIVCVNPGAPFTQETNCSLTFASNVNTVELGKAKKQLVVDDDTPSRPRTPRRRRDARMESPKSVATVRVSDSSTPPPVSVAGAASPKTPKTQQPHRHRLSASPIRGTATTPRRRRPSSSAAALPPKSPGIAIKSKSKRAVVRNLVAFGDSSNSPAVGTTTPRSGRHEAFTVVVPPSL